MRPHSTKEQRMRTKPSWYSLTLLRVVVLLAAGIPPVSFAQTYDQWLYTNSVHYGLWLASEEAAHADAVRTS
jgi:hypothetical protein